MAESSRQRKRRLRASCTLEHLSSWENLLLAARKARKRKTRRPDVEAWWSRREAHLERLQEELLSGAWRPGGYRLFWIREPKRREIAAAPFEDRVVHHALCNVMQPLLEHRFHPRSYSCQTGKGTLAARETCRKLTNRFSYVLKCDVRKFFPNIDHAILLEKLAGEIRCPGILELCRHILGSFRTGDEIGVPLFPGDDLVQATERPRGLPIGNLTSELWGNFYLDAMDHALAEVTGDYLRYTDDCLVFHHDKAVLWDCREKIEEELRMVRLKLAVPKSRLLQTREGVPFCGMRFFPGLRPRILGATKRRFEKRRHRLRKDRAIPRLSVTTFAWYQFSREANTEGLRRAYFRPLKGLSVAPGPPEALPDNGVDSVSR